MRVRRSTVGLVAVFLVALVTYLFVRPEDPAARAVVPVPGVAPSATEPDADAHAVANVFGAVDGAVGLTRTER